jgi:hypothetical protein
MSMPTKSHLELEFEGEIDEARLIPIDLSKVEARRDEPYFVVGEE